MDDASGSDTIVDRQTTSFSSSAATSNTKPRIESFFGTNGLALMRAIDWRTSVSRSPKAPRTRRVEAGSGSTPEAVVGKEHAAVGGWMRTISMPSRRWLMASERSRR